MKTPNTTSIILILAIVGAAIAYFYYVGNSAPSIDGLVIESQDADVGLSTIRLLEQIQTVRIDTSFFSEPSYRALLDYSVAIPAENVGRPNPFAPI